MGCGASPRRLTATHRGARGWCKPRSALPDGSRLNEPKMCGCTRILRTETRTPVLRVISRWGRQAEAPEWC